MKYTLGGVGAVVVLGVIGAVIDPAPPAPPAPAAATQPAPAPTQAPTQAPPSPAPSPAPALAPSPAPAPPPAPTQAPAPPPAAPAFDPATADRAECQVKGINGGTFWITMASAAYHNWSACDGETLQPEDIDALLAQPGADRRCLSITAEDMSEYGAMVGVYSSGKPVDVAAAKDWCDAAGFDNG